MYQIEKIQSTLRESFPSDDFTVVLNPTTDIIDVSWDTRLMEYQVCLAIGHLSQAFNTFEGEQERYPHKIHMKSMFRFTDKDEMNRMFDSLCMFARQQPRFSQKVFNREIGDSSISGLENLQLKTSLLNYIHLVDSNYGIYRSRFSNPTISLQAKVREILDSPNYSDEVKETIVSTAESDRFRESLDTLRNVFAEHYLAVGFDDVLTNILSRKMETLAETLSINYTEINSKILGDMAIEHNHSGIIESIFADLTMEDLSGAILNIPEDTPNYELVLTNSLKSTLLGYKGIDKILFDNLGGMKQTIADLQGFSGFEQFEFEDGILLRKEIGDNILMLSDTHIVAFINDSFTIRATKSLNEKIEITTSFVM